MDVKKSQEVDLERKRGLLFWTGFAFSLAFVLILLEAAQIENEVKDLGKLEMEVEEEEMIPITQQEVPPPPPPPVQQQVIEIVEDDEEIEEELEIEDMEATEDMEIEIVEVQEEVVEEPEIFTIVEDMPSFPGGEAELFKYLGKSIKYPQMAKEAGIQGRVFVTFVVMENGKIANVKLLRGIGGGCDEEAIRVVKSMPTWAPGKQRGKPVRVQYNLPIKFTLQ